MEETKRPQGKAEGIKMRRGAERSCRVTTLAKRMREYP